MSKNITQLTVDTTLNSTDLLYKANSPFNNTDDRAVAWSSMLSNVNANAQLASLAQVTNAIPTIASDFYNANVQTHDLTPLQLTNPLANVQIITLTNTGTLKLPAMNGQTPSWKGRSILIFNSGDQNVSGATEYNIYAQDGTTLIHATLQYQEGILLHCTDDSTANGTFTVTTIPNQRFRRFIQDGGAIDTTFLNAICEGTLSNDAWTAPAIGTAGMYTGFNFLLKNNSSTIATFTPNSPNTIDGQTFAAIYPTESIWPVCNGSTWETIAYNRISYNGPKSITTNYTVLPSDIGKLLVVNSASAVTITLPQQVTSLLDLRFNVAIENIGAGDVTIAKQGTDTITGNTLVAQGATAQIVINSITSNVNAWGVIGGTSILTGMWEFNYPNTLNAGSTANTIVVTNFAGTVTSYSTQLQNGSLSCVLTFDGVTKSTIATDTTYRTNTISAAFASGQFINVNYSSLVSSPANLYVQLYYTYRQ